MRERESEDNEIKKQFRIYINNNNDDDDDDDNNDDNDDDDIIVRN